MSLTLVTPAAGEVVSLREVKEHLRIDHAHDDVYLLGLIRAATSYYEGKEGVLDRAFLTSTWDEHFQCFPPPVKYGGLGSMQLRLSPVQSVTSVKYLDASMVEQTWPTTEYQADLKSEPARILPVSTKTYPATYYAVNAVTVRYVAGYGTRVQVPQDIRHYLAGVVAHWYENREAVAIGGGVTVATTIPMFVDDGMRRYKVWQAT